MKVTNEGSLELVQVRDAEKLKFSGVETITIKLYTMGIMFYHF